MRVEKSRRNTEENKGKGNSSKGSSTLRTVTLLVHPQDKANPKESVYEVACAGCRQRYVEETKRKRKVRVKVHRTETGQGSKIYKRQKETVGNRDVGIGQIGSYYGRKPLD